MYFSGNDLFNVIFYKINRGDILNFDSDYISNGFFKIFQIQKWNNNCSGFGEINLSKE